MHKKILPSNIRTNPHINTTYTQPFTIVQTIPPNTSNTPTYNTKAPSTTPSSTVSKPTCIYSSASNTESFKPFDGL